MKVKFNGKRFTDFRISPSGTREDVGTQGILKNLAFIYCLDCLLRSVVYPAKLGCKLGYEMGVVALLFIKPRNYSRIKIISYAIIHMEVYKRQKAGYFTTKVFKRDIIPINNDTTDYALM